MSKIAGRYEITAKLGEGGMGVVYRAYDPHPMDREVAVKTLHHFADPLLLDLFYKECRALKSISHPNIVEIFDMGEFEDGGHRRPFFVMPLLAGQTLDDLIRKSSHRLTVDRVIEIVAQTCRGLQAAHDRGLIHRDLKPSNIFVMADDSVKIIDFGVAHAVHAASRTAGFDKGTLLYMAPEQVQHKPVSIQSDIYSLAVTVYEALTRRQPFRRATEEAVIEAILGHIPPPASELNPSVNQLISRVVHKALAKQPWNRFDTVKEFSDTLQKASRNEPIALFDPARIQPRIQTASRALEKGDVQFAGEIVAELEAEGNIDPEITLLRTQIDQIARQKTIAQLLESARARYEEEEDPLALQKLHELLQLDPGNVAALGLKGKIEDRRSERQIEKWVQLARQHVANHSYGHAREALQNALVLRPRDTRATRLLKEIEGEEREYVRLCQEKTEMYDAAVNAWKNGEISHALSQMKRVLDIDQVAPESSSPDGAGKYQSFYNKIRSEHDALNNGYAQARRHLADKQFAQALQICQEFLEKYPGQALFQALKFDVEEHQRQQLSAFIAEVDRRLDAEQDLDTKVNLLREAASEYPQEAHFARLLKLAEDKRDLVNSIVERARIHEERGQISEALSDLDTLQTIYGVYPGLKFEKDRLQKRLEQHTRDVARGRWVAQVDQQLDGGNWQNAIDLVDKGLVEFPEDRELFELRKLAQQGIERTVHAERLLTEGQQLCAGGEFDRGVELLKDALQLDDRPTARLTLRDVFVLQAQAALERNWRKVEAFADRALELDPSHALARSLRAQALDHKRQEVVEQCASQARRLQAAGDLAGALAEVNAGLTAYPADSRLTGIHESLTKDLARARGRTADVEPLNLIRPEAGDAAEPPQPEALVERTRLVVGKHANEPEFQTLAREVRSDERVIGASHASPQPVAVIDPATLDGAASPSRAPAPSRRIWWVGAASAAIVIVLAAVLMQPRDDDASSVPAPTPSPAPLGAPVVAAIRIQSAPGAEIRVDDRVAGTSAAEIELGEGKHSLEASLAGATVRADVDITRAENSDGDARVRIVSGPPETPNVRDERVARGQQIAVPLTLTALATLTLQQAPAGARVLVDKTVLGTVAADGRFSSSTIPVGQHSVQVTHPEYDAAGVTREFSMASPVSLSGSELGLRRLIEFLADADTTTSISQNRRIVRQFTGPATVPLAEGTYDVRAVAPSGREITPVVSVAFTGSRVVDLRVIPSGLERFSGGWITRDSWQTRKGGGFVLYNRMAPQSTVSFTVKRDLGGAFTGGQRTKWVVAYRDPGNHVRMELGGDRLLRVEMVDGRESREETRHTIPKVAELHVSVHVEGGRLVHQYMIPGGKDWVTFNEWTRDNPLDGQFGFYLPNNDEIELTHFEFRPATTSPR